MMTCPARPASRRGWAWAWAWVLAAAVMAAAAVRAPGAAGDLRAAAAHLGGLRPAWLGAAVAAEGVALAGGTAAQRQLLAAVGARWRRRTVFGLVLASTGLARVMPAGPVTGGAWQVREYRRRGAGTGPGVWAVLAGGVASTVVLLALLLAGAAAAGPLAGPAVRLRRWAAGRTACPAARRDRRRGRRRARHAHPHGHPTRRGGSRGHRLPGGRVLGRRRRRDRGGSSPRPLPHGRPGSGRVPAASGRAAAGRDVSRPASTPARRHRSARRRHERFHSPSPPSSDAFPGTPFITCQVTAHTGGASHAARKLPCPTPSGEPSCPKHDP